jgi:hypothetical protein
LEIDDPLGIEFALWWIGMSYKEISLALKGAGIKPSSERQIGTNVREALKEIERKTGMKPKVVKSIRNSNII